MDAYAMVATERVDLADVLDELSPQQASTPSLCRNWSVQDVAAHVVMVLEISATEFLKTFARCRGNFDRANDRLTAVWSARGLSRLSGDLLGLADSTFAPPGAGPEATLADTVVHGMDIREPLGIDRAVPMDAVLTSLRFLVNLNLPPGQPGPSLVPRRLLNGLRLVADDLDFTHGAGPAVTGSGQDLLLAITGRLAGARRLAGPGAGTLLARLVSGKK